MKITIFPACFCFNTMMKHHCPSIFPFSHSLPFFHHFPRRFPIFPPFVHHFPCSFPVFPHLFHHFPCIFPCFPLFFPPCSPHFSLFLIMFPSFSPHFSVFPIIFPPFSLHFSIFPPFFHHFPRIFPGEPPPISPAKRQEQPLRSRSVQLPRGLCGLTLWNVGRSYKVVPHS